MNNGDSLEQQALASAKQYMGGVAWPTVCYALVVFFSYGLVLASALAGALSLWIATPMVITLTYLSYTVLHEAVHGTITGGQQSLRWINEALGYIAGWILMTPLTAHRHEHLAHHRNTNDKHEYPDYHISQIGNSPIESFRSALHIVHIQLSHYLQHRWNKAPARQNLYFCA
jgi:beta-carotene hydroxylase